MAQASHPNNSGRSVLEHVLGEDVPRGADFLCSRNRLNVVVEYALDQAGESA